MSFNRDKQCDQVSEEESETKLRSVIKDTDLLKKWDVFASTHLKYILDHQMQRSYTPNLSNTSMQVDFLSLLSKLYSRYYITHIGWCT